MHVPRQAWPPSHFEPTRRKLNERLVTIGEPAVCEEEQTGVRLYTGPMFIKCAAADISICPRRFATHLSIWF